MHTFSSQFRCIFIFFSALLISYIYCGFHHFAIVWVYLSLEHFRWRDIKKQKPLVLTVIVVIHLLCVCDVDKAYMHAKLNIFIMVAGTVYGG